MALRTIIPTPYLLDVYPIQDATTTNSLGNKVPSPQTEPVQRPVQSIHVLDSGESINPAYIDRVITHVRLMVPSPRDWHDGDVFEIPNMGTYTVNADPEPRDMGPLARFNYLLGGKVLAKRVN